MDEGFLDAPEGTREQIMRATYLALCEHGYADLTIQRIADEFPKSKSLIYHHYDGKDELLLDFLAFVLDSFEDEMPVERRDDPAEHLRAVLDHVLAPTLPERRREFAAAMVELRAQAAHDERYRAQFTRHDEFFRERLAAIVEAGVEEDVFAPVDPEATATLLVTTFTGAIAERSTNDVDTAETVREQMEAYVEKVLRAE